MRWILRALFVSLVAFAPLYAQSESVARAYSEAQRKGVTDAQAGKVDEGMAAFKRCLELIPNDSTSAYNIACCYSLKKEIDPAFEWLGKAIDWGFAALKDDELALFETTDADIANLRADARFAPLLERLKARRKTAADFAATPAVYVPAALEAAANVPLLVVVHDAGDTAAAALEKGPWKKLADELGTAVVIPSARCMVGNDPSQGMRWFELWLSFAGPGSPFTYEKTIGDAVSAFRKSHKLESSRVYIVGVGQGGMVAFDVATSSPGLYKGAVVVDSAIIGQLATSKGPSAGKLGMKCKLVMGDSKVYAIDDDPKAIDAAAKAFGEQLSGWAIAGGVERYQRKADDPAQLQGLVKAALTSFAAPAAAPVEAGGEKK